MVSEMEASRLWNGNFRKKWDELCMGVKEHLPKVELGGKPQYETLMNFFRNVCNYN